MNIREHAKALYDNWFANGQPNNLFEAVIWPICDKGEEAASIWEDRYKMAIHNYHDERLARMRAEAELEKLKDPVAVHINMIKRTIATPSRDLMDVVWGTQPPQPKNIRPCAADASPAPKLDSRLDDGTLANFSASLVKERDDALAERDKWREKALMWRRYCRQANKGAMVNGLLARKVIEERANWRKAAKAKTADASSAPNEDAVRAALDYMRGSVPKCDDWANACNVLYRCRIYGELLDLVGHQVPLFFV